MILLTEAKMFELIKFVIPKILVFELAIILCYILHTASTQTDQPPDPKMQLLAQGKRSHECCVNNGYMCYDLVNRSKNV